MRFASAPLIVRLTPPSADWSPSQGKGRFRKIVALGVHKLLLQVVSTWHVWLLVKAAGPHRAELVESSRKALEIFNLQLKLT